MKNSKLKKILFGLSPIITIVVILALWEAIVVWGKVPKWIMMPASDSFKYIFAHFGEMWPDVFFTIKEIFFGYLGGVCIGIILALIFTSNKTLDRAISPYITILIVTPMIVIVPILMIYLGFGIGVKIFVVSLASFPIVMMNTMEGVRNVDPARYELMKSLQATKLQTFFQVLVPSALPNVFTGMRVGCIFATTSAIGAELAGSAQGIAQKIIEHVQFMRMDRSMAYVLVLACVGVILYFIVTMLESKFVNWHN